MAFDAFIKLDGIDGESEDSKHKKWIEIDNYNFGASQPQSTTVSSAGNLASSRVNIQNFVFSHKLDLASPKLFDYLCRGKTIPKVVVKLNRAGGNKETYMMYTLTDAVVTSVETVGNPGDNQDVPSENVSLAFGKVEQTYTKIGINGQAAGNAAASWNLRANEP